MHDICPVCYWQDSGMDIDQLDVHSDPNHMTLRQGRENFAAVGACDPRMLPHVCSVTERTEYEHHPRQVT